MKKHIKFFGLSMIFVSSLYADVNCTQVYNTQNFTERFYENVLERKADDDGLTDWTNNLTSKTKTGSDVAYGFVFSQEYIDKNTDNKTFITTLYQTFFDRDANTDLEGLTYWQNQLDNGISREEVLNGFIQSQEFEQLALEYGIKAYENTIPNNTDLNSFVERFYTVVLHREADTDGLNDWVERLNNGTATGSDIAEGFIFSNEYNVEEQDNVSYLTTLYQAFFNREPDPEGFNLWMDKLIHGTTHKEILDSFLHSQEFIKLSNTYNIIAFDGAPIEEVNLNNNIAPIATIESPSSASFGDSINFSGLKSNDSDGNIACYWWDENGIILSTEAEFTKDDFNYGKHHIRLTVVDDESKTASVSTDLRIDHIGNNPIQTNILSQELINTISYMGNEERLAYDVYNKLYEFWGTKQFTNIANNSEIKHIQEVQGLVQTYILNDDNNFTNIDLPALGYMNTAVTDMQAGTYDIFKIQTLYDNLVVQGSNSEIDALKVACIIEVVDVTDLDAYITLAEISNATDIVNSFNMLRNGSYNHYWAFDNALIKKGVSEGCCAVGTIDGVNYCHPEYPR